MKHTGSTWNVNSANQWGANNNQKNNNAALKNSSINIFSEIIELQKRIKAKGFVIAATNCSVKPSSPFKILMNDIEFDQNKDAKEVLENMATLLASHVRRSPYPIYWVTSFEKNIFINLPKPARKLYVENPKVSGLAFPVHLGGRRSGLAIFFAPSIVVTREMQIDFHLKTYVILRELLRIDMMVKNDSIMVNTREIECLQCAGNGMTSDKISELLNLSVHTVNAHLSSATAKLDSVNRTQAIANAIRLGLIR